MEPLTLITVDLEAATVSLSDGSRWVVSRDDAWAASTWLPAHPVTFHGVGVYRRLENLVTGSAAEVILDTSTPVPITHNPGTPEPEQPFPLTPEFAYPILPSSSESGIPAVT